jgi:hypothetical protein
MAYIKLKTFSGDNCLINCDNITCIKPADPRGNYTGSKVYMPDVMIEVTETVTYIENLILQNYPVSQSMDTY